MVSSGQFGATICSPVDQTFYCRMSRLTGEVDMVFSLVFVPALLMLYFYIMYKNRKNRKNNNILFPF